jgi:hypothetical protein
MGSMKPLDSNALILPVPRSLDFPPRDLIGKESADYVGFRHVRLLGSIQDAITLLMGIGVIAFIAVEGEQCHEFSSMLRGIHDASK